MSRVRVDRTRVERSSTPRKKNAAAYFSQPVQNTDRSIPLHRFTEEFIAELEQAVQTSPLGRAYREWSAHRALTALAPRTTRPNLLGGPHPEKIPIVCKTARRPEIRIAIVPPSTALDRKRARHGLFRNWRSCSMGTCCFRTGKTRR